MRLELDRLTPIRVHPAQIGDGHTRARTALRIGDRDESRIAASPVLAMVRCVI
jgi:hypothetical protein